MEESDYAVGQAKLLELARTVRDLPLREMIGAMQRAETIGPVIDPTLYRQAAPNMRTLRKLAEALLPFQVAINKNIDTRQLHLEEEIRS